MRRDAFCALWRCGNERQECFGDRFVTAARIVTACDLDAFRAGMSPSRVTTRDCFRRCEAPHVAAGRHVTFARAPRFTARMRAARSRAWRWRRAVGACDA
jgi:hypothetical protein